MSKGITQKPALLRQVSTYCHPRTLTSREKPKWSRDRTLSLHYRYTYQCSNIPPDCPTQVLEGHTKPPSCVNHSPDKADLFFLDLGYSGNDLHCVIVEDIHTTRAKGEAQAVVSKPYTCQLLDKAPDKSSGPSTDTLHLKGVNVAILMDIMKNHHPELCGSILEFLSMAENLDIHLVNKISSSYSESTYADIFVNKIKVQAIIDTGAPINIVSTRLVNAWD
ncbi:hypothetical protein DSO57_1020080 [Entomophthora muscae]|uniref:Uncharacterized protein n=1 Tax=Entomophthora muscae TaxID=34485 RepID=A0ACC2T3V3_9FUNG|nr:hypothetical protein DSO57_1020080 [Entomophthora muscae]